MDVWIENRNQHGSQSKPVLVRWPLRWDVTDRKDTWSDEFLMAARSYLKTLEMLDMTKEQSEENFERVTKWTMVAIDFETATATKIHHGQKSGHAWSKVWECTDTNGRS